MRLDGVPKDIKNKSSFYMLDYIDVISWLYENEHKFKGDYYAPILDFGYCPLFISGSIYKSCAFFWFENSDDELYFIMSNEVTKDKQITFLTRYV